MDDKNLLISALSGEYQLLEWDELMAASCHPEAREMTQQLLVVRRETICLIEQFAETSPFRGQVARVWHANKRSK
jgi:hypothetical protein